MDNPTYLEPLNKEAATKLAVDMDALLEQISIHELKLSRSYARLGGLLREVKLNQYWISYGYDRFSSYLEFVRTKIGRERSQVYAILQVAESLLPLLTEGQLEEIGISKSHELRRLVEQGGNVHTEILDPDDQTEDTCGTVQIMDYAARPKVTAKMLRVAVNEILHIPEDKQGLWFDPGGFYATPEERKEIEQFWGLGKRLLAPKDEQQDHVWKKVVFMDAVRESVSTWAGEAANA